MNSTKALFRKRLRWEILCHYSGGSPHCACCGDTHDAFLCIDHVKGGGNKHRKQIGEGGMRIYEWIRREKIRTGKYPKGFRVLCSNCNGALGRFGECPHEIERREKALLEKGKVLVIDPANPPPGITVTDATPPNGYPRVRVTIPFCPPLPPGADPT
jgi:hypothetical protein